MSPTYNYSALNDAPDDANKQPGCYHAEVASCKLVRGKESGLPRFDIELIDINDSRRICFDRMMLDIADGGSTFPLTMTKAKFKALGVPLDREAVPDDLVGRRCWVFVDWGKEDPKTGNCYLGPVGKKNTSKFGYWSDSSECPMNLDESQASSMFKENSPGAPASKREPQPGDPDFVPFAILPFFFLLASHAF